MRSRYWLGWTALGIVGVVCVAAVCSSDEKKPAATVRVDDLWNGRCIIVGRLEKPYGEVSKLRRLGTPGGGGTASKDPQLLLRITHLDGGNCRKIGRLSWTATS